MNKPPRPRNPFAANPLNTPCVGICSTTFGDLVCRGCKRFSHEVVRWNNLSSEKKELVWERLLRLRRDSINAVVRIEDMTQFIVRTNEYVDQHEQLNERRIYEFLTRSVDELGTAGLTLCDESALPSREAILEEIENEYYIRSCDYYEQIFKHPMQ